MVPFLVSEKHEYYHLMMFLHAIIMHFLSNTIVFLLRCFRFIVRASWAIFGIWCLISSYIQKPNGLVAQGMKSIHQLIVIHLMYTFIINEISVERHLRGLIGVTLIIFMINVYIRCITIN